MKMMILKQNIPWGNIAMNPHLFVLINAGNTAIPDRRPGKSYGCLRGNRRCCQWLAVSSEQPPDLWQIAVDREGFLQKVYFLPTTDLLTRGRGNIQWGFQQPLV